MPRHSTIVHLTLAPWFALPLVAAVACSSDDPQPSAATSTTGGGVSGTVTSAASSSAAMSSAAMSSSATASSTTVGATTSDTNGGTQGAMGTGGSSAVGSTGMATMTSAATTGAGGASTGTGGASSGAGGSGGGATTEMTLTSPGFTDDGSCSSEMPDNCDYIPRASSSFHDNESPELNWTPGPEGTQSYAVVFHDLSNGFAHWAIWNLSAATQSLPPALPGGATLTSPVMAQQTNASFAPENGYYGPGSCSNEYEFKLYALNVAMHTPSNSANADTVQDELEASDIVLATATLRGRANPADGNNCP
jgi:Raf kinase inhibitor-like YbhB/YbcL family protein